jgi:2-polyprenylphenol hydroxylase and related flavodoxin oxidoreductases
MMDRCIIENVHRETPTVVSLYFTWSEEVKPGQFVMVWVPELGEVPMSLSMTGSKKCITVKSYGESTRKLCDAQTGDFLYLRGPYGRPFNNIQGKKLLMGGGSGMASLRTLIDAQSTGIVAAKSAEEILFEDEFVKDQFITVTEDGSRGIKGIITDALGTLDLKSFHMIYVCGPENMLKAVFDRIKDLDVRAEFSLERSMKCGIGLCDSCSINGFQVCLDGPTFSLEELKDMDEFGRTKLLASGRRVMI